MSLSDSLYRAMAEELAEAHLALDRLGAPREVWEDSRTVRELTTAERISFICPLPSHVGDAGKP